MAKYPSQTVKFMHGDAEVFGQYYMHSAKARQNARKRKQINKQNKH